MMRKLEELGFVRVAVASPELKVADVDFNTRRMIECIEKANESDARIIVFPELSLTGYSCADLFHQRKLLESAKDGLIRLADATSFEPLAVIAGVPLEVSGRIYNCGAFICGGNVHGFVPKTYLPNAAEYYERRWFASSEQLDVNDFELGTEKIPMGTDLLFELINVPGCVTGIEICEDLWAVEPMSGDQALAGATILANLSAGNELLGKAEYRKDLVKQQSGRCLAAYLYSSAGPGESTTDQVFSGHGMIAENGIILTEQECYSFESTIDIADVDVQRLISERTKNSSFITSSSRKSFRKIKYQISDSDKPSLLAEDDLMHPNPQHPFVPSDVKQRSENCSEIFNIQSTGLAKRLKHLDLKAVTIGISGGLDSTLALLATVRAFKRLEMPLDGIHAVTMPGFGTTERTKANAEKLATLLGVKLQNIPITNSVKQHFKDIDHDEDTHDIVYENAQARERTQILMDLANKVHGFVVGTGDLSESALGWCTYNGDHMSMYHVNVGIPKTLVRYIIEWCAECEYSGEISELLRDVCETPVTPELLPAGKDGEIVQKTEDVLGPYELHDFFLFNMVRHGFTPTKIAFLAKIAYKDKYSSQEILDCLERFYSRFFSQQYKRSAMPDGPKVGTVALSPRADWRMPSDAAVEPWLDEIKLLRRSMV